jgi:hypothetical protein
MSAADETKRVGKLKPAELGSTRFWCMHGLVEDRHFRDLARWVADGVLMPLVDDEKGDIIGYMHCDQADWLCNLLNRSQQKAGKTSH